MTKIRRHFAAGSAYGRELLITCNNETHTSYLGLIWPYPCFINETSVCHLFHIYLVYMCIFIYIFFQLYTWWVHSICISHILSTQWSSYCLQWWRLSILFHQLFNIKVSRIFGNTIVLELKSQYVWKNYGRCMIANKKINIKVLSFFTFASCLFRINFIVFFFDMR